MKKITLSFSFALLVAHFSMLNAQVGQTLRLSLSDAQNYAVEHNYSMQNATLEVQKAEFSRWQTLASMLPQVKAGFDYQNMCGYTMNIGSSNSMMSMMPDSITIGGITMHLSFPSIAAALS